MPFLGLRKVIFSQECDKGRLARSFFSDASNLGQGPGTGEAIYQRQSDEILPNGGRKL